MKSTKLFISNSVDIFVKLSNFIPYFPGVRLLTPCSVLRGVFLYTIIVPGEGFCSLQVVYQGFVLGGGGHG